MHFGKLFGLVKKGFRDYLPALAHGAKKNRRFGHWGELENQSCVTGTAAPRGRFFIALFIENQRNVAALTMVVWAAEKDNDVMICPHSRIRYPKQITEFENAFLR
jgi:hypothetical protein